MLFKVYYPDGFAPMSSYGVITDLIEAIAKRDGWASELEEIKLAYPKKR